MFDNGTSEKCMKPRIEDFLLLMDELAPPGLAEAWDNPGLQAGGFSGVIERVFLALDPTPASIERAHKRGAQVLFTHHPLIFRPMSRVQVGSGPGRVLRGALKNEIHIVAAHTNLDAARGGLNDILADLLGLERAEVLEENAIDSGAGVGRVGLLPVPMSLADLLARVRGALKMEKAAIVGDPDAEIRRVAVVGGSGGSFVTVCRKKAADCLVTGDIGHHHALEAMDLGMNLIDAGHYRLEQTAFRLFGERLERVMAEKGWSVRVIPDEDERDPIQRVG